MYYLSEYIFVWISGDEVVWLEVLWWWYILCPVNQGGFFHIHWHKWCSSLPWHAGFKWLYWHVCRSQVWDEKRIWQIHIELALVIMFYKVNCMYVVKLMAIFIFQLDRYNGPVLTKKLASSGNDNQVCQLTQLWD
jgi:hypothetical protein